MGSTNWIWWSGQRRGGYSASPAAFSLVEILIALGVVAVLLGMAAPMYTRSREQARERECRIKIDIFSAAIRELAWDTGKWPGGSACSPGADKEVWDLSVAGAGLLANDGTFSLWTGPYARDVPIDPWGQPYFFDPDYRVGGRTRAVVGSFGPNRRGRNMYDSDDIYVCLD